MLLRLAQTVLRLTRKTAICGAFALALSPMRAISQTLSPPARQHFAAGRQAQDANHLDKAASEYAETIRLAPTFAGAYTNLGLVDYVQGNFRLSSEALAKAVQLDRNLIGANLYLGIDLLKLNRPTQALPYLQHAALLDPGNKDAQSWLGTAYWQTGQTRTALEQFRQINRRFPNDPDLMFVLGEAYRKTADRELETLIHTASGTPFVHKIYGDIYLDQQAFAKAAGHYQAALQQSSTTPNIHFDLGEVELLSGHPEKAAEEYRKQLQLTPTNAAAEARLAEATLLENHPLQAIEILDQALALSPLDSVSALHLPPLATLTEPLTDRTLDQFRAALPQLEISPDNPARNLAIALAAANLGQVDRLGKAWTDFSAAIPPQPPAATLLARAQQDFERQSFEQSADEIHTWIAIHPTDLDAQYLAAKSHRRLYLAILESLLTDYPDSPRSHQLLAQTYEGRDDDEKAIAEYRKVEELSPTLPGVHFNLGHLLLKDGDLEQATSQLQQELHLSPDQPEANAELGMALVTQNQPAEATPYLTKALSISPNLWIAHQQLGKALYLQKNYLAARGELTLALADDPEGLAHYQLGLVYKALGDIDASNKEFASSRRIKSDRLAQVRIELPSESNPGAEP